MSAEDFSDFDKLSSSDRPPLGNGAVASSPTDGTGNPSVSVDFSSVAGADDLHAIEALSGTGYLKRTGTPTWALVSTIPWSDISSPPTTLAGYGIVDAQPLDGDLTAIAALTGTNTLYYRSGASTWSPVTIGTGIVFSAGVLSAGGGSGAGGVATCVARGYVSVTNPNAPGTTLALSSDFNVASVTINARGRYRVTFSTAIAAGCVLFGSATFPSDSSDNAIVIVGIDRHPGYGMSTTSVDINMLAEPGFGDVYDPLWLYFEVRNPADFS